MTTRKNDGSNQRFSKARDRKLYDRLSGLPVELVHQVFSDLSLSRILEVLCVVDPENLSRLDECLLDHPKYFKVLFPNNAEVPSIRERIVKMCRWEYRNTLHDSMHYVFQQHPDRDKDIEQASFWHIRDESSPLFASALKARIEHLLQLKRYFRVYLEILACSPHTMKKRIDALHFRDADWCLEAGMTGEIIMRQLKSWIIKGGLQMSSYGYFLPALRQFMQAGDINSETDKLPFIEKEIWDWDNIPAQWALLRKAETRLNLYKSAQLRRLADLIQRFPGKLQLGRNYDGYWNVKGRDEHAIKFLLSSAEKLKLPGASEMWGKWVAGHVFKFKSFPLVPYSIYLQGFLKVLAKFPVDAPEEGDYKSVYPEEIKEKIRHVLADFAYYHTRPDFTHTSKNLVETEKSTSSKTDTAGGAAVDAAASTGGVKQGYQDPPEYKHLHPEFLREAQDLLSEDDPHNSKTLRTWYTPFSSPKNFYNEAGGKRQPAFAGYSEEEQGSMRFLGEWKRTDKYIGCIMPLVESEFVWLEKFMEICEFMQEMEGVQWKEGVSVAEWWKAHTSP